MKLNVVVKEVSFNINMKGCARKVNKEKSFKKRKYLTLLVSLLMASMLLTGCFKYDLELEFNRDRTASMQLDFAVMESMTEDGVTYDEPNYQELFDEATDMENITIETTPLEYELEDGVKYVGEQTKISFDSGSDMFSAMDKEAVKVIDLGENKKRIELYVENENTSQTEEGTEVSTADQMEMFKLMGLAFTYRVSTDFEVTSHNADIVEDNVYIWDLLEKSIELNTAQEMEQIVLFIEFIDEKNIIKTDLTLDQGNNESNTALDESSKPTVPLKDFSREGVEDWLTVDRQDFDFHGKALWQLGILKGNNNGLDLDKNLTRVEGAVMYSRLLGLEDEIEAFKAPNPNYETSFKDVPEWAKPTINYLHYSGLINGIAADCYGSNYDMTKDQYATLILRALGYQDSEGDFNWETASDSAINFGLYDNEELEQDNYLSGAFTRRGMTYISYNALFFENVQTGEMLIINFK